MKRVAHDACEDISSNPPVCVRICYSGIRFFYQHVLQRDWHALSLIRAQTEHRLPAVLSVEEVRGLLKSATPVHHQVHFATHHNPTWLFPTAGRDRKQALAPPLP